MNRPRLRLLVLALTAGIILATGAPAALAATAATPSITLKPTSGPPTTKVTVSGKGFGATVSVTVNFAGTKVATVATSATGTFSTSFKVPKSEPPGSYSVAATAGGASASGKFTVRTDATMFRYNLALTGVNPYENVLNASNVSGLQTSWTESTSGAIGISPAVVNGSVYVPANNGFFVYNASTGKLLWSHPGVFFTSSSPAVSGGMVYVAGADGNFYAFSTTVSSAHCSGTPATCSPVWTAPIVGANTSALSSAVVSGGSVFVSADTQFYSFNSKTGTLQWKAAVNSSGESPVSFGSTPAIVNGIAYVGGDDGPYGYTATGCGQAFCQPVWHGDATTVGSLNGDGSSSPAVVGGVLYIGAGNSVDAFATSCNNSCKPLWSFNTGGAVGSSPAAVGGKVYAGSWNTMYVLSTSGSLLWSAPTAPGDGSSPTVANGVVYIGSFHGEFAFNAAGCGGATCNPIWTSTLVQPTFATPVVANGILYTGGGTNTKYLYAFKLP